MRLLPALCLIALSACAAPSDGNAPEAEPAKVADRPARDVPPLDAVEGRWRVVSIDGEALPDTLADGQVPQLSIASDHLGGNIGCNSFGALALYADGRFATHSWSGTAMYCAGLAKQEQALSELFFEHPALARQGGRLSIRSARHKAVLDYLGPPADASFNPASQQLSGTRWRISFLDRREDSSSPQDRFLSFTDDGWRGLASCATLFGTYRRKGNRLMVDDEIANTEQLCPPEYAARDDAFAALMRSDPRYLIGPNGELIITGGGHMLTGGRTQDTEGTSTRKR